MTVGDALREALPNSMILIASGRYVESTLMLDKPGIVLQASGDGLPVITSYGTTVCISATVQLHGLHITTEAPSTAALVVAQGQPLISKCHLRSLHVDMASTPVVDSAIASSVRTSSMPEAIRVDAARICSAASRRVASSSRCCSSSA